jgi:uncharacterized protein
MECRSGCGVCCIYISISSPIPGMPEGKVAGVRCVQLTEDLRCAIFNEPSRPKVCDGFKADRLFCGDSVDEAIKTASWLMGNKPK